MAIEVGRKIRGRSQEIVWVSDDKRVFGTSTPDDLGKKGVVWGKMHFQKLSMADREEFWNSRIQIDQIDGVWYMVLDTAEDYPQIFSKCIWWTTDKSSAYSQPEPIVMET